MYRWVKASFTRILMFLKKDFLESTRLSSSPFLFFSSQINFYKDVDFYQNIYLEFIYLLLKIWAEMKYS